MDFPRGYSLALVAARGIIFPAAGAAAAAVLQQMERDNLAGMLVNILRRINLIVCFFVEMYYLIAHYPIEKCLLHR